MTYKFNALLILSLGLLLSSCSESMTMAEVETCERIFVQEVELLEGYKDASLTVAEVVGDSLYTAKVGGAITGLPKGAFYCAWSTKGNSEDYNAVKVIFELGKTPTDEAKLLWLSDIRVSDRGNKTLRRFDYIRNSFQTFD